ncbi:hypothetical protein [Streptomyces sp. NPDC059994]|uniref:hypothetical protein n=1 Tax=Streptomyces sp. NPDC059994 TaxID=3347029 RepID=UPI003689E94C
MWFYDAVATGFQHPTDPGRLQWFRILFGAVLTARFALSLGQGGWHRFSPGSLSLHLAEQRFGPARARLLATGYRPALLIRTTAAVALAAGLAPRLSLLLVLAGAAMELLYLKSPNAVRYTLLTGCCLLLAGDIGHGLHIHHGLSTANTWAQCLLVLITIDIYWNSAWHKLRSPPVPHRPLPRPVDPHLHPGQGPASLPTAARDSRPRPPPRGPAHRAGHPPLRAVAVVAIATEIALPPALLIEQTMPYAVLVGIGMHAAFTCLKPRQLITFSGLTTATYVAFAA